MSWQMTASMTGVSNRSRNRCWAQTVGGLARNGSGEHQGLNRKT
jgi:hypothetical protein